MMTNELQVQKALTDAFIDADLEMVSFSRCEIVPDGAGGWRKNPPSALPSQRVRLVPSTSSRQVERTTSDGSVVEPSFTLLGREDLDVRVGDRFVLWGANLEVVHVHERQAYQRKADVIRHG